jgi:formylglycine-generating enzyme required for sulfatase activity
MNMKCRLIAVVTLLACGAAHAVSPSVTNIQATQLQDATRKVRITYTLTDPDSATVYVSLAISTDNGATYSITPTGLTGDIGWVRPGGMRTIYWDAKAQYPTGKWSNCKARVTADDSSGGVYPGQMIYIPAGSFLMGNNGSEGYSNSRELPQHSVYLSGYYIGKYEVTRGEYRAFMNAGGYSNSAYWSSEGWSWKVSNSRTESSYWAAQQDWGTGSFTQSENHPVVGVTYYEAEAFCAWAGGHLPTEAEWEKAARWTGSYPNVYPWGNAWDAEKCNNYYDHNSAGGGHQRYQTAAVGSYPSGASPYGCQDMAGNVWEWVKDWYGSSYYSQTPSGGWNNPQGPASGSYRILRGGGWNSYDDGDRCACRYSGGPDADWSDGGFRLAR